MDSATPLPPQSLSAVLEQRALSAVFQPIVDLSAGAIFGYEGLVRGPADTPWQSPLKLVDAALREGRMVALDHRCAETIGERFDHMGLPGRLFLNISPEAFCDPDYQSFLVETLLRRLRLAADRVVLEITEQQEHKDYEHVRQSADFYRRQGFRIALDDLGAGYAGLRLWSELRPDFVKVDRHFIENLHRDVVKRDFLSSILAIGRGLNCRVIAEGIETADELGAVRRLGISLGQGYHLGRPAPVPPLDAPAELRAAVPRRHRSQEILTAAVLRQDTRTVTSAVAAEDVLELFLHDASLTAIPVVDESVPRALVTRQELLDVFSARYMRELRGRKAIGQLSFARPLIVEEEVSLDEVSRMVADEGGRELTQVFLMTHHGRYRGVGHTRALLGRLTEQRLRAARHSNPLTLLPGNVPLSEYLGDLLHEQVAPHVAYYDINHFKPYNDAYGYRRGDAVILLVAELLRRHAGPEDFVAHIGGDDFMVIHRGPDWRERCEAVLADFAREIVQHYPSEALASGGIQGEDRHGVRRFYPIQSLSVGVVHPDPQRCGTADAVAELAGAAKREAKKIGGNALFVCQRRGDPELRKTEAA